MEISEDERITITRGKGDCKVGSARFEDLDNFRWDTTNGGVRKYTGSYGLYAYVYCDKVIGKIGHSCEHGTGPHYIKVYIPKGDNKKVYNQLAALAGEKPANPNGNVNGTSDRIRDIVGKAPGITAVEIAEILAKEKIRKKTVQNCARYLKTHEFKRKPKLRSEKAGNTQKLYLD